MFYYLCILFICIIICSIAYIRVKLGFWAIQPVFHVYNIGYMFNPPGIIDDTLPKKNKYTNFKNIETIVYSNLSPLNKQRIINIIKLNYLQNKENTFSPTEDNIFPYFNNHNDKSFFSVYTEDTLISDLKKGSIIEDKKTIGIITGRPINIHINKDNASFDAYYVDYLCVDQLNRKKGIAAQLIQTHQYNQRHLNKKIVVSLFKREEVLTGIVPLTVYSTYGFPVTTWSKPHDLSAEYGTLLEINSQNIRILLDFIAESRSKFEIQINTESTNIIELIKTKNIFIYTILSPNHTIKATYFYRKSCTYIKKGFEVLSCFASISNCEDALFIQGFKISFWKISAENNFGFSAIEEISDNYVIINNLKLQTKPLITSPTAYFFYNFAYSTFHSSKVFIMV